MNITFTDLGGPFKTTTASNDSGKLVATIRRIRHPRLGQRWGVNSRLINGWRYFETIDEAKAIITEVEEEASARGSIWRP